MAVRSELLWGSPSSDRQRAAFAYQTALAIVTRRSFRSILISLCLILLTFYLLIASGHGLNLNQTSKAEAELKAHEKVVPNQQDSKEPLKPFPETPMESWIESDRRTQVPWLAAVMSPAQDIDRRMIIRSTWMRMYADVPFEPRFVVSNPGSQWTEAVQYENRSYGDMIVLGHLSENAVTANTIKTLEFYKWLVSKSRRYEFVTKIDTDLWFNARGFWDRYIEPRLNNTTSALSPSEMPLKATVERTAIGQLYYNGARGIAFPQGAMYTHTWDLVELLVKLQEKDPIAISEDAAVTTLLKNAGEQAHMINMNSTEKFDYDKDDTRAVDSPWARTSTHPTSRAHALYGRDMLAVHELKGRNLYMQIANCFDSKGVKGSVPLEGPERTPPFLTRWHDFFFTIGWSARYKGHQERIASSAYRQQGRDWIVSDVWNMGQDKTGYQ